MRESTGALVWIIIIIAIVVCMGLSIRSIKQGLSEPRKKTPMEEHMEQQEMLKQANLDQKQLLRDAEKAKRDAERQMRDSQRLLKAN